jgi:type I restriction enzyme S subunit
MVADRKIGDFVTLRRGTTYKGALVGQPGPALLGLGSIVPGGGFRSDYKTYGGECPPELMLLPGDLYVSLKGATKAGDMIGSVARVPETITSGRLTQDTVRLVFDKGDAVFEQYLYWLLRTPDYRNYCAGRATGSAVAALSREDFLAYPVPPLTTYRRHVVNVLEKIESKIESNRRLVTLIPQLIHAMVTKSLDADHQQVPVADLATFVNGGAFTKGASGTGRLVIRIAELNSGPVPSSVYSDIQVPEDKTARPGDVLMSWSGSLSVYRWALDEAIVNQHIFKVLPVDGYPAWLVFDRLNEAMPIFQRIAKDKATTMGHIQRGHLKSTLVHVPTAVKVSELDRQLAPPWERLLLADREIIELSNLRDTLLPELLSGRNRIAEAERAVTEATA